MIYRFNCDIELVNKKNYYSNQLVNKSVEDTVFKNCVSLESVLF